MDRETIEELKRHFGVVAEGLRSELRAVAEGQAGLQGRIDRLEARVDLGFKELQSMIRLSYTEIDRRFEALETDMHELRARVERLEARGA
jgi:hypothetical protein